MHDIGRCILSREGARGHSPLERVSHLLRALCSAELYINAQYYSCLPHYMSLLAEIQSFPSNECLCIVKRIQEYLSRTAPLRKDHTQLFISFQSPFQPVSKDTIARWVKETLKLAGIDTSKFSAHSCRAASTSAAHKAGLSLPEIMAAAGWSNVRTFNTHALQKKGAKF